MKSVRLKFCLLTLICLLMLASDWCTQTVSAQNPIRYSIVDALPPDSIDVARAQKKHFWRATAEIVGFNAGLAIRNRIVRSENPSFHVTWKSIWKNLKGGFKWDNDHLISNTFAHPYSGSLYYNAARSSGYNYWQSELFTMGGSLMWEYFMESEYPSINDFVSTSIGGAAFGEVLYRTSDALIDDTSWGVERFGREFAALVINPLHGFNRLITGQMWRRSATTGRVFGTPDVAVQISLGPKAMLFQNYWNHIQGGMALRLDLEYGNRFEVKSTKPYDYFTLRGEANFISSQPMLSQLNIKGRLIAREFLEDKDTHMSLGLYQHFDYYDSDTIRTVVKVPYKLGIPASLGAGLLVRDVERGAWIVDAYAHANAVILGGILSDHFLLGNRCYNWASGFSVKAGLNAVFGRERFSFSYNYEFYRLFTWAGYRFGTDLARADEHTFSVMGDVSQSSFHINELKLDLRVTRHIYATLIFDNYLRHTRYRDYDNVVSSTSALRLMATYKF